MKKQLLMSFIALLIAIPSVAPAYGGRGHGGKYDRFMTFFDTDNDGVVTREEFARASAQRFAKLDGDSSGTVSADELSQYLQERRRDPKQRHFESMDSNSDGYVSLDEYLAVTRERAERRFKHMDKDADGLVSSQDFGASKRGHKKYGGKRIFSRLDGNGDGQVTKEESETAWLNWFNRLDVNGDQLVTVEEIQQAHTNRRTDW